MAGAGERFKERFPETLKPFIKVQNQCLFELALESINSLKPYKLIFVMLEGAANEYKEQLPENSVLVALSSPTQGALETCLKAESSLDPNEKLLLLDSDLSFKSNALTSFILSSDKGSGFPVFNSSDPRFSYAKTHGQEVIETREKEVISNNAIAGAYYFEKAHHFLSAAKNMIQSGNKEKGEFYISPVFNELIKNKIPVKAFPMEDYHSLGTPEELDSFLSKF